MKAARRCMSVAVLLSLGCLAGCSGLFFGVHVEAEGNVDDVDEEKVELHFWGLDDGKPVLVDVRSLSVREYRSDGEEVVVWHVRGKELMHSIKYGKKYKKLREVVEARPLSRDARYYVTVSGFSWRHPPGMVRVRSEFYSDSSGQLHQVPPAGESTEP